MIVPPDAARACSDRMRSLLGYSIHPPFLGQVDGMHPLRLVDAGYREHKTADHIVADRVLTAPRIHQPGSSNIPNPRYRVARPSLCAAAQSHQPSYRPA